MIQFLPYFHTVIISYASLAHLIDKGIFLKLPNAEAFFLASNLIHYLLNHFLIIFPDRTTSSDSPFLIWSNKSYLECENHYIFCHRTQLPPPSVNLSNLPVNCHIGCPNLPQDYYLHLKRPCFKLKKQRDSLSQCLYLVLKISDTWWLAL